MTQKNTHSALNVIAFLAFLSLLITLHNTLVLHGMMVSSFKIQLTQFLYCLYLLLLIVNGFIKKNAWLFLGVLFIPLTFSIAVGPLYQAAINPNFHFMNVGRLPGILDPISFLLVNATVIVCVTLRCYRYWNEKKSGLNTQF